MLFNVLGVLFLGGVGAYFVYYSPPSEKKDEPIWNEQIGKTRSLQAKGDASLNTELIRRRVIQSVGRLNPKKLKESKTQKGTSTGAIETFMLSAVCPKIAACPPDIVFDGGGPTTEYCPLDNTASDGIVYDAGNDTTTVQCSKCFEVYCPSDVLYEGGNHSSDFCPIMDGDGNENLLDGGNQNTRVCGV